MKATKPTKTAGFTSGQARTAHFQVVASTSESGSTGIGGTLFAPRSREDTLSIAALSWRNLALRICLVFCFFRQRKRVLELDMFLGTSSHNWTLYTDTHLQAVFFFIVYWFPRPPKTIFIFIQQNSSDLHVRVKTMTLTN